MIQRIVLVAATVVLLLSGCGIQAGRNNNMKTDYTYTTQEKYIGTGTDKIYGIQYIPDREGKMPLVIFSHELGYDHSSGIEYAEELAQEGIASYRSFSEAMEQINQYLVSIGILPNS